MVSLSDLDIKTENKNPVKDTKERIARFWETEGKPNLERVDSSIKINGEAYHILVFVVEGNLTIEII